MELKLNVDLRLVVEGQSLIVRFVDKGEYPYFEETIMAEANLPLAELASALASEAREESNG